MTRWDAQRRLSILLLLLVTASLLPVREATPEGDTLYQIMTKWSVTFNNWTQGGDPCAQNWTYVMCRTGNVVNLNVSNTGITGGFPTEIGDLRHLEVLDISNVNSGNDSTLVNALEGDFPASLEQCTRLRSFNASNMEWNISFPIVLTKLPMLEELYLANAKLSGAIPDEFYQLSKLRYLFLGSNDLTGSLVKMAQLENLIMLSANTNDFKGTLPPELSTLTDLEYLNLHTCNLYGALPDAFSNFTSIRNLTLHRNNFTGKIPDSWKGLTTLRYLRIDQNYLSGSFPTWMFSSWPDLSFLQISKNEFSGEAPDITNLDEQYNVSNAFWGLKWDCNYLNGTEPCSSLPECSPRIQALEDSNLKDPPFAFNKNCYDNNPNDEDKVSTDCGPSHTGISCDSFYETLRAGQCPRCPNNQMLSNSGNGPNGKCVCKLADPSRKGVPVGGVVGGVVGLIVVFLIIIALILYKRRKHFSFLDIFNVQSLEDDDVYWEAPPGVEKFTLHDLSKITQNFSEANLIGQGGFGKVFVGTLEDGRMVAIKRASAGGLQGHHEFKNEVTLLSRLHHRHLVKLEGFCDEDGLQILVYEFMQQGNLHDHITDKNTKTHLHWYKRLEIAYQVAQGLEYLHSFADPPVIHRDVKPSNILLDDKMVAKVSDFGISKINPEFETHVSTRPAGTAGYLDPDYFLRRQLTTASDVYAYGVVLLELVTGQEAIDHTRLEEFNLIEWVKKRFITRGVVSLVDPLLEDEYSPEAFSDMVDLGLRCASFDRRERPSMKEVLNILSPHLVVQSLYTAASFDLDGKPSKGANLSFDSEYLPNRLLLDHTQISDSSDATFHSTSTDGFLRSTSYDADRTTRSYGSYGSGVGQNLTHMARDVGPR